MILNITDNPEWKKKKIAELKKLLISVLVLHIYSFYTISSNNASLIFNYKIFIAELLFIKINLSLMKYLLDANTYCTEVFITIECDYTKS